MAEPTFSERVINVVRQIPKGKVMTYGDIAHVLGCSAYRAVGQVMKNNECGFWLDEFDEARVPCHRVVASGGKIGGYSRGFDMKKRILESEGILVKNEKIVEFEKKRVSLLTHRL